MTEIDDLDRLTRMASEAAVDTAVVERVFTERGAERRQDIVTALDVSSHPRDWIDDRSGSDRRAPIPKQATREHYQNEAEMAAAWRDAQRYRWWTENFGLEWDGPNRFKVYTLIPDMPMRNKEQFDAAIDAAMSPGRKGE